MNNKARGNEREVKYFPFIRTDFNREIIVRVADGEHLIFLGCAFEACFLSVFLGMDSNSVVSFIDCSFEACILNFHAYDCESVEFQSCRFDHFTKVSCPKEALMKKGYTDVDIPKSVSTPAKSAKFNRLLPNFID